MKFARVDAELSDQAFDSAESSSVLDADQKDRKTRIEELFRKIIDDTKITVRAEALKADDIPAMILLPEQARRFAEMAAGMGQDFRLPGDHTLVVNTKNQLIQKLAGPDLIAGDGPTKKEKMARQVYRLARLSQGHITPEELETYTKDTYDLLGDLL